MTYYRKYTPLSSCRLIDRHNVLCSDLESILLDRNSDRFTNRSRYQRSVAVVKEVRELKEHYWKEVDDALYQDEEIIRLDEENDKLKKEIEETMKFSNDREWRLKDILDEKDKRHREDMDRVENNLNGYIAVKKKEYMEELDNEKIKYKELEEKHLMLENKYNHLKKRLHEDDKSCANKKQKINPGEE